MNETTTKTSLRKLCESRHRKLIVAIVSTVFGLLVLIPLVDDYFDKKESHRRLTDKLAESRQTAKNLPEFERHVTQIADDLAAVESRSVSEGSLSNYRSRLVELVRNAGCQVRKITVGSPTVRPWSEDDDPLVWAKGAKTKKRPTPFVLERRNIVLLVDGPNESVHDFMKKLHQDKTFTYARRVDLRSSSTAGESVALELELWVFSLNPREA